MWNETNKFIDRLHRNDIGFMELTPQEIESHRQEWFINFVPSDKRAIALNSYCFDNDGCCGYLWHVFSYEILNCLVGDKAACRATHVSGSTDRGTGRTDFSSASSGKSGHHYHSG